MQDCWLLIVNILASESKSQVQISFGVLPDYAWVFNGAVSLRCLLLMVWHLVDAFL